MNSFTTRRFRDMYGALPANVRVVARRSYRLFRDNPYHPGLNFKKVDDAFNIYSVRVGIGYRALGRVERGDIVWFWIGSHAHYELL